MKVKVQSIRALPEILMFIILTAGAVYLSAAPAGQSQRTSRTSVLEDVNRVNRNGQTALMIAARQDNLGRAEELLAKGADSGLKDNAGNTALMIALDRGNRRVAELLLPRVIYINEINRKEETALMLAAENGLEGLVDAILEKGAQVNVKDKRGNTALLLSAENGHVQVCQSLIANGADVNANKKNGETPLIAASKKGYLDVVINLLNSDADVNMSDSDEMTALHYAAKNGYPDIAMALINAGADIDMVNEDQLNALFFAAENGEVEIIKALLDAGADIDARNQYGGTPLMLAVREGHVDAVRVLIENGADVNAKDNIDVKPLAIAKGGGNETIIQMLKQAGAGEFVRKRWFFGCSIGGAKGSYTDAVNEKSFDASDVTIGVHLYVKATQNLYLGMEMDGWLPEARLGYQNIFDRYYFDEFYEEETLDCTSYLFGGIYYFGEPGQPLSGLFVKANFGIATASVMSDYDSDESVSEKGTGFSLGAGYEYPISSKWSIGLSLGYSQLLINGDVYIKSAHYFPITVDVNGYF